MYDQHNKRRVFVSSGVSVLVIYAAFGVSGVHAQTIIEIGEGTSTSWTQAIAAGIVNPVPSSAGFTGPETWFYDGQANSHGLDGVLLQSSVLTPDIPVTFDNETHESLVMGWDLSGSDDPGNNFMDVGAWELSLPNPLTMLVGWVELNSVELGWDDSVEFIDANGNAQGYFSTALGGSWATQRIVPGGGDQGFYRERTDPDFDPFQIVEIRIDRSGIWEMPFPDNPSGGPEAAWAAYSYIRVGAVPAPATALLISAGLLVGTRRRRQA